MEIQIAVPTQAGKHQQVGVQAQVMVMVPVGVSANGSNTAVPIQVGKDRDSNFGTFHNASGSHNTARAWVKAFSLGDMLPHCILHHLHQFQIFIIQINDRNQHTSRQRHAVCQFGCLSPHQCRSSSSLNTRAILLSTTLRKGCLLASYEWSGPHLTPVHSPNYHCNLWWILPVQNE